MLPAPMVSRRMILMSRKLLAPRSGLNLARPPVSAMPTGPFLVLRTGTNRPPTRLNVARSRLIRRQSTPRPTPIAATETASSSRPLLSDTHAPNGMICVPHPDWPVAKACRHSRRSVIVRANYNMPLVTVRDRDERCRSSNHKSSSCPLVSPPDIAISAGLGPVNRQCKPSAPACPGPGPHGVRSDRGSSRAAETSCRRRSEATSSRWFRRCSRRLALVTAASASTGAIMLAAASSVRCSMAGRRSGAGAGDQVTVTDSHHPALRMAPAASSRRQCPRASCICCCQSLWLSRSRERSEASCMDTLCAGLVSLVTSDLVWW
jgi:hypothetical protein